MIAYSYIRFSTAEQLNGHSLARQLERTREYCASRGLTLDESIPPDLGRSAYSGEHLKKGSLGDFLARVKADFIPAGSALVIENLDRLSRQGIDATIDLLKQLNQAGIEVHDISDGSVLKAGFSNNLLEIIKVVIKADVSGKHSEKLKDRLDAVWRSKKDQARSEKKVVTRMVPGWLTVQGGEIVPLPDRVATLRKIFTLAAQGFGRKRIADRLTLDGDKPFTDRGDWTLSFIATALTSRAAIGEYQPTKKVDGRFIPDGPPVEQYFPRVIDQTLYDTAVASVSAKDRLSPEARKKAGARGGNRSGGKTTHKNLFTHVIFDVTSGESVAMNYHEKSGNRPRYLVTGWKPNQKANRIRYERFESAFLGFLQDLDWQAVAREADPEGVENLRFELEKVAIEIHRTTRLIARDAQIVDDPDNDLETVKFLQRGLVRYEARLAELQGSRKRLAEEIEAQIAKRNPIQDPESLRQAISSADTDKSEELRYRLRQEILRRVSRIDFDFGTGGLVVFIRFVNGADRMIDFRNSEPVLAVQRSWERGQLK
jgi:DNA invertase Pin-like site-specific DNA recombinase